MALTNAQRQARYRSAGRAARIAQGTFRQPVYKDTQVITLTLPDLAAETQRQIRERSQDFHYSIEDVAKRAARLDDMHIIEDEDVTVGMEMGSADENLRRAQMVQFALVTTAAFWSANGGIGQAFCWFTISEGHLLGHWRALQGPGEWFGWAREVGLAT